MFYVTKRPPGDFSRAFICVAGVEGLKLLASSFEYCYLEKTKDDFLKKDSLYYKELRDITSIDELDEGVMIGSLKKYLIGPMNKTLWIF